MASRGPEHAPSGLEGVASAVDFLNQIRNNYRHDAREVDWSQWLVDSRSAANHGDSAGDGMADVQSDPPERLGRFRVIRHLGSGGFADVYLARDPELDREVAIKVLSTSHLSSREAQRRLEREARALARISHPNVVPVFELGTTEKRAYLTSEYCQAQSLEEWIDRHENRPPRSDAVAIVAVVAEALEHCHRQGICHRDIKPSNILLQEPTSRGTRSLERAAETVKIIDFGLAKHTVDDQFLTLDGTRVGTPAYMSPEQARGETVVTPISDVYSVGAVLYHLLVGCPPNLRSSYGATLRAIQSEPVSRREFDKAGVPRDLQAICGKALEKKAEYRYDSAGALASDLRAWLDGHPVSARPVGNWGHVLRWTMRHPLVAVSSIALVAILLLALLFTNQKWLEAKQQSIRADRQVRSLLSTSDFVLAEYTRQLESNRRLDESQRAILDHMVGVHYAMLGERGALEESTGDGIETILRLVKILRLVGETDQATNYIDVGMAEVAALDSTRLLQSDRTRLVHEFLLQRFLVEYERASFEAALAVLEQMDENLSENGQCVGAAWRMTELQHCARHRALCYRQRGEPGLASVTLQKAIQQLHQDFLPSYPELAYPLLLMHLAQLAGLDLQSSMDESVIESFRAIDATASELLKSQPDNSSLIGTMAQCQSELAMLMFQNGSDEAREMIDSAVERFSDLHQKSTLHDFGGYVLALRRKAIIHRRAGGFTAAHLACQKALAINAVAGDSANRSMEQIILLRLAGRLAFDQDGDVVAYDESLERAVSAGREGVQRWPNSYEVKHSFAETLLMMARLRSDLELKQSNTLLREALSTLDVGAGTGFCNQREWRLATRIARRYFMQNVVEPDQVGDALSIWDRYCALDPDEPRLPELASAALQRFLHNRGLPIGSPASRAVEQTIAVLGSMAVERRHQQARRNR